MEYSQCSGVRRTFVDVWRQTADEHFPGIDLHALRAASQRGQSSSASECRRQSQLLLE